MASIWPMMLRPPVSVVFSMSWVETVVLFSESDGILPSARVRLRFAGGCEDDDGTVTRGTPVPPWLCATVGDSNVFRTLWTEPLGVCILEETGEVPPVFKIDFNKGFSKGNSSLVSFIADSFFWRKSLVAQPASLFSASLRALFCICFLRELGELELESEEEEEEEAADAMLPCECAPGLGSKQTLLLCYNSISNML